MTSRVYLDWNASAPLRPEARAAMLEAMDLVGNPSSVHAEGRAARAVVEKSRGQVAGLVGCEPSEVVFTSGATEAAAIWFYSRDTICASLIEHDAVLRQVVGQAFPRQLPCDFAGVVPDDSFDDSGVERPGALDGFAEVSVLQSANSETGVIQPVLGCVPVDFSDITQSLGKVPLAFDALKINAAIFSAHKLGGPKGVGGLALAPGQGVWSPMGGSYEPGLPAGQEQGRRAGTENVIGISGFGAAAEAAQCDLEAGVWDQVENLRDSLEIRLEDAAPDAIFFGKAAPRLPNTSCFAVPGWKGETQVMQMDLAGYAVSAGSACSSGKVGPSRVLKAMGFDDITAASAIRVSMGPTTTEAEVMGFADAWIACYRRWKAKAA